MWHHVVLVWTYISKERIVSIFRIENPRSRNQRQQVAADWPEDDTFLRNVRSYKFYTRHIPEDGILYIHRRKNLKSYIDFFIS
jgi:hypothetical protein